MGSIDVLAGLQTSTVFYCGMGILKNKSYTTHGTYQKRVINGGICGLMLSGFVPILSCSLLNNQSPLSRVITLRGLILVTLFSTIEVVE